MRNQFISILFMPILLLLGATSCNKPKEESESPVKFALSDTMMQMISIDTVHKTQVEDVLKLSGKITYDEDKMIKIYPLVGGEVSEVKVELGDFVNKGQVLAVIHSAEVAQYRQDKIAAEGNAAIAQRNLETNQALNKSGVNSDKELLEAQREVLKSNAELQRLKDVFKINSIDENGNVVLRAPVAGFIVEKKVNPGFHLRSDNNENLFTLSGLDQVWVSANVYEADISKIKEGYDANVTTLSYEDKIFKGKVDKVYNVLDPESKVMKVRIKLENKDYRLKPEMFANVLVQYKEKESMLSIPTSAIIFDNSKNYVLIYHSKTEIEIREIQLYKSVGDISYVASGLKVEERLINRYHLLVYDALND